MTLGARKYAATALCLLLGGCATQSGNSTAMHGRMSNELRQRDAPIAVQSMHLDRFDIPHFGQTLPTRPDNPGERYYLVVRQNGRPIAASAMAVCRAKPEGYLLRSFNKGTAIGAQMSTELMRMPAVPTGAAELHAVGSTMPIMLGMVGGLAVGALGSGPENAPDTVHLSLADYQFEYDTSGQLHTMTIRTGAGNSARTQTINYSYDGGAQLPGNVQPKPVSELLPENIQVEGCQ